MRFVAGLLIATIIGCGATPQADQTRGEPANDIPNDRQCEFYFARCGGCAGGVLLEFDIDENGRPENLEILASCPPGKFDRAALEAVSGWEYEESDRGRKHVRTSMRYAEGEH